MNRKILSVAMTSTMLLSSTAMTAMALENTEVEKVVTLAEGIELGAIKRSASKTLVINKSIVLDLDGKKLSSKGATAIKITNGAKVIIRNGTISSDSVAVEIEGEKTNVTIEKSVTIETTSKDKSAVVVSNKADVTVKKGNIQSKNSSAVEIKGKDTKVVIDEGSTIKTESNDKSAVSIAEDAKVDIKNSNISSNGGAAVYLESGVLTISDLDIERSGGSKGSAIQSKGGSVGISGTVTNKTGGNNATENLVSGGASAKAEQGTVYNGNKATDENKGNVEGIGENVIIGDGSDGTGGSGGTSSGGGSISKPSKPTYTHKEIIGKDRYETAALIADQMGSYDTVVLVNSDKTMADGLSAAPLASKMNAPILPIKQNKIPASILSRINKAKNVYIIGGTDAISIDIEKQLSSKKITRISGKTRFETSQKIADRLGGYSEAYIVNGVTGEADAMSASPLAAREIAPIIVTNGKNSDYAKKSGVEYTVIGGEKAVSKELAKKYSADRVYGATRYETNREIIKKYYGGSDTVYVANGETMIDALSASVISKNKGVVLVSAKSDNSILKSKNTVQVGGMKFSIKYE